MLFAALVCVFSGEGVIFGQTFVAKDPAPRNEFSGTLFPKEETRKKDDRHKFEAGILFTSLMRDGDGDRNGIGGRFTYDFAAFGKDKKYVAAWDSEFSLLTGDVFTFDSRRSGRVLQGFSGLKIGRQWDKFGVFLKERPGFVQYSRGRQAVFGTDANPIFSSKGETNLAFDTGGILEFYPTKRITTRFDFGDTMVRFGNQHTTAYDFFNNKIVDITQPSAFKHNLSFSVGIGFRF
jgi:hypothetical protein